MLWSGLLRRVNDIDAAGHLADVGARDSGERTQIDHLDGARLGAHALDRDERVAIVAGDGDAMHDTSLRGNAAELLPRRDVDDGDGPAAFVRSHEQLAVVRDGEVVDAV